MYKKGSIVLIPFPFSDLSSAKVRPAVIVSDLARGDDVLLVFVSSLKKQHLQKTDIVIKSSHKDFSQTGLKVDSIIKVGKIATLEKKLILGEMGCLGDSAKKEIDKKLKIVFGL